MLFGLPLQLDKVPAKKVEQFIIIHNELQRKQEEELRKIQGKTDTRMVAR